MKQIVNGKVYDTDKSEWYEELPIHEVDYEIAFGESPEEA